MSSARARHWNSTYEDRGAEGVSWYQALPAISLELVEALGISHEAPVIDIGGGASSFAKSLLERGFKDVTVLDISRSALALTGSDQEGAGISLIEADVLRWNPVRHYDVWHDRATFHFLVADRDRSLYTRKLEAALAPGGFVILATFAPDAPPTCSGLPVVRYSEEELAQILGPSFDVLETRREQHRTPRGARQPFTWVAGRMNRGGPWAAHSSRGRQRRAEQPLEDVHVPPSADATRSCSSRSTTILALDARSEVGVEV